MLLFMIRFLKHLFTLVFVNIPLQLLGALILLMYLPFSKSEKLPVWLKWVDNADIWVGRDPYTYLLVCRDGWWARYCWLAWRNPLNYFGYVVQGADIKEVLSTKSVTVYSGDVDITKPRQLPQIGDSHSKAPGFFHREVETLDGNLYEYYYIHRWSATKCFRFRMGYKLGQDADCKGPTQAVFVIQPWKSYTGL